MKQKTFEEWLIDNIELIACKLVLEFKPLTAWNKVDIMIDCRNDGCKECSNLEEMYLDIKCDEETLIRLHEKRESALM